MSHSKPGLNRQGKGFSRILVVDDSIVDACLIRRQIESVLGQNEIRFTEAPRLVDAFECMNKHDIDLILLDLNLLDICGAATVTAMHDQAPDVPIIVYSGSDDRALRDEVILCGAQDFLVKGRIAQTSLKSTLDKTLMKKAN